MLPLQVTVIGDSYADPEKYMFCEKLGGLLAKLNLTIITGGKSGVMEAISKGAVEAGGLTVGILPGENKNDSNPFCRVIIPTGLGHSRNALTVLAADVVIVVGGQAGTLTEIGFAWINQKPLIAVKKFGGWAEKLAGEKVDSRQKNKIIGVNTLDELKQELLKIIKHMSIQQPD